MSQQLLRRATPGLIEAFGDMLGARPFTKVVAAVGSEECETHEVDLETTSGSCCVCGADGCEVSGSEKAVGRCRGATSKDP